MELEERVCEANKCRSKFKVLPDDDQAFCSVFCRTNHKGDWKEARSRQMEGLRRSLCQNQETLDRTGRYGTQAHGEAKNPLRRGRPEGESTTKKTAKRKENEKKKNLERAQSIEKRSEQKEGRDTIGTQQKRTSAEQKTSAKTGKKKMRDNENGIEKTEKSNGKKNELAESKEIQHTDSQALSTVLKEEKSSSIQLLDDSANQLMNLAESVSAPRTKDTETGEITRRATDNEILMATKCFENVNQILKTKLDYLKFGNELRKSESQK